MSKSKAPLANSKENDYTVGFVYGLADGQPCFCHYTGCIAKSEWICHADWHILHSHTAFRSLISLTLLETFGYKAIDINTKHTPVICVWQHSSALFVLAKLGKCS